VEKKIVVPQGMIERAVQATCHFPIAMALHDSITPEILAAALRWLSENPIVPTEAQALAIVSSKPPAIMNAFDNWEVARWGACEWQRRMFLAPDEDDPIKDLMEEWAGSKEGQNPMQKALREAFRRGQKSNQ
jgi:hypothetical protein